MIVLSEKFVQEIVAHPIPADLEVARLLAASSGALDCAAESPFLRSAECWRRCFKWKKSTSATTRAELCWRLFVACSGLNVIAVIQADAGATVGLIPSCWRTRQYRPQ